MENSELPMKILPIFLAKIVIYLNFRKTNYLAIIEWNSDNLQKIGILCTWIPYVDSIPCYAPIKQNDHAACKGKVRKVKAGWF